MNFPFPSLGRETPVSEFDAQLHMRSMRPCRPSFHPAVVVLKAKER
jgi:hypothetical protein